MSGTPNKTLSTSTDQLPRLVGAAILLFLLAYGRDVLIPIVLAIFLALLIAPLIRRLRQWGLGQVQAVTVAVVLLLMTISATGLMLGTQAIKLASSLPKYETTIRNKLQTLDQLTLGKMNTLVGQADRMVSKLSPGAESQAAAQVVSRPEPLHVQVDNHPKPFEIVSRVAETVLPPLETAGIVLIVLIFILLDYDSLRDRVIRLVSGGNLRATTHAITDATERLSRFFVSQFAVNLLVGALVGVGLGLAGLSGSIFWGALTAVSRFIPYIGIWLAAGSATLLAAAMSDGWALMIQTVAIYAFVEIVIAQFFEPRLYGHSTGLSPLSVVISAIFWSAMWGPVGLILSTPLTLCLVVAGRHVQALKFLEILLGDLSALSHAERFYQRALSGDAAELVRGLKQFLKDKPLYQYADQVMLASIRLAYADFTEHEITQGERERMRHSMAALTDEMSRRRTLRKSAGKGSVLLAASGTPQPSRPRTKFERTVLVTSIGEEDSIEQLVARVLVNVLHSESIEAHYQPAALLNELDTNLRLPLVFIVCVAPEDHAEELRTTVARLRECLPDARLMIMRVLEEIAADVERPQSHECGADGMVHTYQDVIDTCYLQCAMLAPEAADRLP